MPVRNNRENAGLIWILLIVGLIAGLFSLLAWPFRAIARRLPGRREKSLQVAIEELRNDMRAAQQLLQALLVGDPKRTAKLDKRIEEAERQIKDVTEAKGWPEDLEGDGPGFLAGQLLEKAGVLEGIDWRGDPEDLKQSLTPLLKRRGISLDWTFVKAIEATGDGEALRNTHFLPVVGDEVEKLGFVLAQMADGSDAYLFAVCSPDEFSKIDGLTCRSFTIRRLSSATGPAIEP